MGEAKRKRRLFEADWPKLYPGRPARVAISRPPKRPYLSQQFEKALAADIVANAEKGRSQLCLNLDCHNEILTLPAVFAFLNPTGDPSAIPIALFACDT